LSFRICRRRSAADLKSDVSYKFFTRPHLEVDQEAGAQESQAVKMRGGTDHNSGSAMCYLGQPAKPRKLIGRDVIPGCDNLAEGIVLRLDPAGNISAEGIAKKLRLPCLCAGAGPLCQTS
jgi:hypothetical protein